MPRAPGMPQDTTHKSPERLRLFLELESVDDFKSWIASDLYKPFWETLYQDSIKPEQEAAKAAGKTRRRGQDLSEVQGQLIQCEAGGKRKYSRPNPDKSQWTKLDHYASFLHWVSSENVSDQNGIFFGKGLPDDIMYQRVWKVLQYSCTRVTPSHVKVPGERQSERQRAQKGSAVGSSSQTSRPRDPNQMQTSPDIPSGQFGGQLSSSDEGMGDEEEDEMIQGLEPKVPSGGMVPESTFYMTPYQKKQFEKARALPEDESPPGFKAGKIQPLTAELKLRYKERSVVPNFNDPYWRFLFVVKACNAYGNQGKVQEIGNEMFRPDALTAESLAWTAELGNQLDENIEEPDIVLQTPTKATTEQYNTIQALMDNEDYQREDYREACQRLQIVDPRHPRLRSMPRGVELYFWQVLAIDVLIQSYNSSTLKGLVLADAMGLGKTISNAGFLMRRYELRQADISANRPVPPAKPTMIVVPPQLIDQFIQDLDQVWPDVPIHLYYGHKKNRKYGGNVTVIDVNLTRRHPLFNGEECNSKAIIITSPQTLAKRHGPNAQRTWRVQVGKWSPKQAKAQWDIQDPEHFPYSLKGLIDVLIIDEAHCAKKTQTATHLTLLWLDCTFKSLNSATPVINHIRDYVGFVSMVQIPNLWTKDNLERIGVDEHVNPYNESWDDDEPYHDEVRKLRCTTEAYRKFIASDTVSWPIAAQRLKLVWKQTMLRRTYQSRVPFVHGPRIGDSIPPLVTTTIETAFTADEQAAYNPLAQIYRARLAKKLENGQLVWNMKFFRLLMLLGTWQGFEHCEGMLPASRTKALLEDPDTIWRLVAKCTEKDPVRWPAVERRDREQLLAAMLRGAPKIRALLKVLSRQVLVNDEKAVVWVTFPGQQVVIVHILRLAGIDAWALHAGMTFEERRQLVHEFQTQPARKMALVPCWAVGSYGWNWQVAHNIHLLDPAPSDPIEDQAIHRCRRIKQKWYVIVVRYYLAQTFNDYHTSHNIKKSLPGVMASLNDRLMSGSSDGDQGDIALGKWCVYENKLTPMEAVPLAQLPFVRVLDAASFVEAVINETYGERLIVEQAADLTWMDAFGDV